MSDGRFSVLKSVRKADRTSLITDVDGGDVDQPAVITASTTNHYGAVEKTEGKLSKRKPGRNFIKFLTFKSTT